LEIVVTSVSVNTKVLTVSFSRYIIPILYLKEIIIKKAPPKWSSLLNLIYGKIKGVLG